MSELSKFVLWSKYCDDNPNVYISHGAREWGLRRIKAKAVAAGGLVLIRGRWYADPAILDRVHLDEARAAAARHAQTRGVSA